MSRTSTSAIGAFHPVLFFILVYVISILMALFVCRAVYISVYGDPDVVQTETSGDNKLGLSSAASNAQVTALR